MGLRDNANCNELERPSYGYIIGVRYCQATISTEYKCTISRKNTLIALRTNPTPIENINTYIAGMMNRITVHLTGY